MRRVLRFTLVLVVVLSVFATWALRASDTCSALELASHTRPAVAYTMALLGCLLALRPRRWSGPILLACALVIGWPTLRLSWGAGARAPDALLLRVAAANLLLESDAHRALLELVDASDAPDIVFISEGNQATLASIDALGSAYPHQLLWPARERWHVRSMGDAILSKRPFVDQMVHEDGAILQVAVEHDGDVVTILGAHPMRPGRPIDIARRNRTLDRLAELAEPLDHVVVLGDLNVTEGSRSYARLLRGGNLRDSRRGFGRQPTWLIDDRFVSSDQRWLARLVPAMPLDHVLLGDGLVCTERHVGPDIGSDHLPVFATLARRAGFAAR
ncbi:endonuclease/exonuclease/phosphatase family protein [Engelhardtia mirabilis]|uniref:Endonuclease/exonuclease/phosphatase domain-containing protein n=1 Tax=Engelhardtia mirabilis TaxID=2528011 RepID=A0A518BMF0_9BACT|nr:hypothetical protein Pla133_32210 [Planctomycetes bacterium Pla133]QDV02453.1 hypothetical protein Pla86_32200 [Planctomycetes bacterium Pla86]